MFVVLRVAVCRLVFFLVALLPFVVIVLFVVVYCCSCFGAVGAYCGGWLLALLVVVVYSLMWVVAVYDMFSNGLSQFVAVGCFSLCDCCCLLLVAAIV